MNWAVHKSVLIARNQGFSKKLTVFLQGGEPCDKLSFCRE